MARKLQLNRKIYVYYIIILLTFKDTGPGVREPDQRKSRFFLLLKIELKLENPILRKNLKRQRLLN